MKLIIPIIVAFVLLGCSDSNLITFQFTDKTDNSKLAKEIVRDKIKIEKKVTKELIKLLPNTINLNDTLNIVLINYSDRGSHANNDSIFIDISDFKNAKYSEIVNLITHEAHHIKYTNWFITSSLLNSNNENQ